MGLGKSPAAAPVSPSLASAEAAATSKHREMLRTLVEQQEEQLHLLETINKQKETQLLQMQQQLEAALTKLQDGQVTYAQQQRVLDEQKAVLDSLVLKQRPVGVQLSPSAKQTGHAVASQVQSQDQDVDDDYEDEEVDGVEDEEQALLRKIRHFEAEKAAREAQLRDLQGMMAALGLNADLSSSS